MGKDNRDGLGIPPWARMTLPDALKDRWEEAYKSFPQNGSLEFLRAEYIDGGNLYLKLDRDKLKALHDVARIVSKNRDGVFLLWLNHILFFSGPINGKKTARFDFPDYEKILGIKPVPHISFNGMFGVLILMTGLTRLISHYRDSHIKDEILIDTLSDFAIWMDDFHGKYNKWGIEQFWWIYNHLNADLYRLGRLQYLKGSFTGQLHIFKNKVTSRVVALSQGSVLFRSDGQIEGTCSVYEGEGALTTFYDEDEKYFTGNYVSPRGHVENRIIRLERNIWGKVMEKNDPVLDCHIAAGEKLTHEACGESLKRAVDFYREFPFVGFMCSSWLLDPQLQLILPPDSNIVRFQRELYLYPVKADDKQTFERVFNDSSENLDKLKPVTSMQRAILEYVKKGNKMHYGSMFFLKDDVDKWGRQSYTQAKTL